MGNVLFAVLPIALIVGAVCVLSGCSDKSVILRTPYGVIDTTTSGTSTLDITPLFPPPPPPKDYTADLDRLTVKQLEK